ncbi:hypothetical protein ALT721_1260005 [Alteromonas alvinellae]
MLASIRYAMTTLDGLFDLTPNFSVFTDSPAYIRHAFTR